MTGLIPRPFIDELLNRTDIVELIDGHVPLKKQGQSYIACCPFHNEKTPSFNVIAKKQFYHCFGCGASGNAISFMINYLNTGFVEAVETLAARVGLQVPREGNQNENNSTPGLYQLMQRVTKFYQHRLKTTGNPAIHYLKSRNVDGQTARLYQLGYAPSGWQALEIQFKPHRQDLITTGMLIQKENGGTYDRYRQRIMFPIHDRHGRIIGFGGRAIDKDQKPKYLNSPETVIFQKSRELYGLYQALQQQNPMEEVLIVEGYMDVIALAQHGISNVVATLGTATSAHHIQLLSKYTKHLIFCFDGDSAGRQAAWRALENSLPYLNSGLQASFIFLPENHDPDSLVREEGKERFLQRLQNAQSLNQFFFSTLTQTIGVTSLAGKSQLVTEAKPFLLKMTEGPYKQLMVDELARLTRIESHRINQILDGKATPPMPEVNLNISRSPIRVATALLLQHPEIYAQCLEQVSPEMLDAPKQNVLQTIMKQVAENPAVNTAALIECWRDSEFFDSLNKLAAWNHQVPEAALAKEFIDIVLFLAKQNQENKIQKLLEKSRIEGLTEGERLTLQAMLKDRHKQLNKNRDQSRSLN